MDMRDKTIAEVIGAEPKKEPLQGLTWEKITLMLNSPKRGKVPQRDLDDGLFKKQAELF